MRESVHDYRYGYESPYLKHYRKPFDVSSATRQEDREIMRGWLLAEHERLAENERRIAEWGDDAPGLVENLRGYSDLLRQSIEKWREEIHKSWRATHGDR